MIAKLKKTLKLWSPLHILFLSRITALKMTILPRVLYLFRSLPIRLSKSYQAHFNKLIWHDKPPIFAKKVLYRSSKRGRLGVPQIWLYYLASRYMQQAQWNIRNSKVPCVKFEHDSITPLYLPGLMWSSNPSYPELPVKNRVVAIGLKLWNQYKTKYNLISQTPLGASYLSDPRFPPGYDHPESFLAWTERNLTTLEDFLVGLKFVTFSVLQTLYHIPDREYYRFLQICYFFQQHYASPPQTLKHSLRLYATLPLVKRALFWEFTSH